MSDEVDQKANQPSGQENLKVFISYSRADMKFVDELVDGLNLVGAFIFIHLFIAFICLGKGVAKDNQNISFKDLFGTSWQAVRIDNQPVTSHWLKLTIKAGGPKAYILDEQDRTLIKKFKADVSGQVDGTSSCNRYSAGFVAKGQKTIHYDHLREK